MPSQPWSSHHDAGTGARSAGIVNQGRVGSLINAKPSDRRILLEEAANIRGLHTRRHEAELRLKAAETNLERLEDILSSVNDQLRGLLKQAKQAKRYRTINDQIRKSESILFYKRWLESAEKKVQALESMAEADKKVREATQSSARCSRQRVEVAEKLPLLRQKEVETAAALQRLNIELNELNNELERLAGDPLDILANGVQIARGEVVMVGERFGVRFTEVSNPEDTVKKL